MNNFTIGYMLNTTLNVNKVFRDQVGKLLKDAFHPGNMSGINNVLKKESTCVISLVIFYENITTNPMKVFRVLIFVLYYVIDNYVCIEYICCQYKKLSVIYSDKILAYMSYNELIGIGISEVLTNLISCHGFMKNKNSTVIFLCRTQLVDNI